MLKFYLCPNSMQNYRPIHLKYGLNKVVFEGTSLHIIDGRKSRKLSVECLLQR